MSRRRRTRHDRAGAHVRRMGGEDAGFLYMERPEQPLNTQCLGIIRPPAGADGAPVPITMDDLRGHVHDRLVVLESFRWRVAPVPFGLHHPVYVDDPDFDIDNHLRHATLPAPGGSTKLDALFASVAERTLDRRFPLWQVVLVDGLAGGRQAVIVRYNHCMADGVAALVIFSTIFSATPPAEVPGPWKPPAVPRPTRLVVDALADRVRMAGSVPGLLRAVRSERAAARAFDAAATFPLPVAAGAAPACSLNDAYTAGRVYTRVRLPLRDVRTVKDAAGVSVNDVALAVVGGALRRVLEARGEHVDGPLTASVPVSTEPAGAPPRQWGNRFSALLTSLATDVDDPWDRLAAVHAVTASAKRRFDVSGAARMPELVDHVPPLVARPALRSVWRAMRDGNRRPDASVLVSNLRGPEDRWHLAGAEVEELYLSGPPSGGVGSNVMLWSYAGDLVLSILSFADSLHSPSLFAGALRAALDELVEAAQPVAG